MADTAILPASAWLWPIMGFHYSCIGYPLQGYTPIPGTPRWPYYPDSGRGELVPPGVAYCPINGSLNFGLFPPFGLRPAGIPPATTKETPAEETNKTQNIPLSDFIKGNGAFGPAAKKPNP